MSSSKFLLITALLATPAVFAAPISCQPATAAFYTAQPEGCTDSENPLITIKNFAWSSVEGYLPVSASEVMVDPVITANNVDVKVTSDAFSVTGDERIRAFFSYTIDPPPPILDDLNLFMDANTPVAPGFARITAIICVGRMFTQGCTDLRTLVVEHYGPGDPRNVTSRTAAFDPVSVIDVITLLELEANGASSQINGWGTTTNVISLDPAVPEPGTAALLLSGLAGAVFLRRRRVSAGS